MSDKAADGFRAFLTAILRNPSENVKQLFLSYDSDNNQSLDLDEFKKFYADLEKILPTQDEDGADGAEVVSEVFKQIDEDQNGVISFDEFKTFIETLSMAYNMAESMKGW